MSQATRAAESISTREALPVLHGLVLSGGASTRMGRDKALLDRYGQPQLQATFDLLRQHVQSCFVSLRNDQRTEPVRGALPGIVDVIEGAGPAAGLLAAHAAYPQAAWLVLACDLPQLQASTLEGLIRARDGIHAAIAYRSAVDGLPEPLCAVWEPAALQRLSHRAQSAQYGLRDVLRSVDTLLLPAPDGGELDNANTTQEWQRLVFGNGQGSSP
jgi:molybdenum cofactor guanylyltransferase